MKALFISQNLWDMIEDGYEKTTTGGKLCI
jgi:hypothetical protein